MKKSNIILIILLAGLYITPAIVWGVFQISSTGDYYTGFGDNIRTIQIENVSLTKEDIIVNTEQASWFPRDGLNQASKSYLYYKGIRKYLPEAYVENDILFVKKAAKASSGEKLKLHIRINDIAEILLNGETVWRR